VYTQCPDCATVFRVTAEALRAAQGDVRCGVCATTFNALENLSEQPFKPAPASDAPAADDSMTVEELPGGENIELETSAQEPSAIEEGAAAESAPAEDEDLALEFHGDAADLDRVFVMETPPVPESTDESLDQEEDLEPTDEQPILVLEEVDEPVAQVERAKAQEPVEEEEVGESIVLETLPQPIPPPPPASPPAPHSVPASTSSTAPRILIPDEIRKRLAREAQARAAAESEFDIDFAAPAESLLSQRWPWVSGIAVLALLLAVQVIHSERNELVRSPALGPAVAGAYDLLGLSPLAPTDLGSYELRQWGAASDPTTAGRLVLRASIVNRATFAQPMPLLRLALQDRFGGTLGERDIGPSDYLPGTGVPGLMDPGERADALIRIVDPGPSAVGFELDVCLPAPGGVRCANQITAARQ
jgi:predicted Zn finger-like uncharacterized protein